MPDSNFSLFPWDQGEQPLFVSGSGHEFYVDKLTTKYAQDRVKKKKLTVFFAKKGNDIARVLMDSKNEFLHEAKGLEAMAVYIDILSLQENQ